MIRRGADQATMQTIVVDVVHTAQEAWAEEALVVAERLFDGGPMIRGGPWRPARLPPTAEQVVHKIRRVSSRCTTRGDARQVVLDVAARLHYNNALRKHIGGRTYKKAVT